MEHTIRKTIEGAILLGMHPRASIMIILQSGELLLVDPDSAEEKSGELLLVDPDSAEEKSRQLLLVDPESAEEQAAESTISLAFPYHWKLDTPKDKDTPAGPAVLEMGDGVLSSLTWGCLSSDQFLDAMEVCKLAVSRVAKFTRSYLDKERSLTA
eukprot:gene20430-27218_t